MAIQSRIEKNINLENALNKLSTVKVLKVGWPEKKKYENGTYYAEAAAQNEYGNPLKKIPPRPFMRPAIAKNKNEWMRIIADGAEQVVNGERDVINVLDGLGATASGDIATEIKNLWSPSLSPYTVALRLEKYKDTGRVGALNKPLIDSGLMLKAVAWAIEGE